MSAKQPTPIGKTFNRFTVIASGGSINGESAWVCRCQCGTEGVYIAYNVKRGLSRSCGCLRREVVAVTSRRHGNCRIPEFHIWYGMLRRCYNKNYDGYHDYGGRGIKVCDRWRTSFDNFFSDMGKRPSSKHTIERKNSNGPYSPENCCWATRAEQNRNTSRTVRLTYNGETKTMSEWARQLGMHRCTLGCRISSGWTTEEALTTPAGSYKRRPKPAS